LCKLIKKERALIYTDFVKDVVPLSIALRERGISSWSYHGKNMSSHDKAKAVDSWCPKESTVQVDKINISLIYCNHGVHQAMVCTAAFGMGVDVPNVDVVIRLGCPPTLEEMVQEFGRAGRDGRQARGMYIIFICTTSVFMPCIIF
jgi:superfamily II DNA helicase RecQ